MDCCLCGEPVGFPVQVPTDEGFLPAHRACAVAAITRRSPERNEYGLIEGKHPRRDGATVALHE